MKAIRKLTLPALFISSLGLTACGGGSDSNAGDTGAEAIPAPLNASYYGLWQLSGDAYVGISEHSITTYVNDPTSGCTEASLFKIVSSTANSAAAQDIKTGEMSNSTFKLNGANLQISQDGETLEFVAGNLIDITNGCGNDSGIDQMELTIDLTYLPPYVGINRDAQPTGRVEYQYGVHFDINQNDQVDAGDVAIQILHFKDTQSSSADTALAELGANISAFIPRQQAAGYLTQTSSRGVPMVQVSQTENRLKFTVDMSQHPLLAYIDDNTPLFIYTYIDYPQPETTVIADWQDGPWNWSSQFHEDRYPDVNFTRLNLHANGNMLDATNDLKRGEAKWVDIQAVHLSFN
ncbi:hypothetical protein [Rheinheimera hassiensis]|uniref:hypothetical protein n=1 Tax=Rheinheimera hassiensis TaxID=1193627 RepID=UPI001F069E72|nr:hypothetical protein [Rheinheimera hassiensis]